MTTNLQRGLATGRDGRIIYPGKTVREKRWDVWDDTAFPSWLSLSGTGATATFRPVTTAGQSGEVQIDNPTNATNSVLTTSWSFDCYSFSSIEFHIRDLYFSTDVSGTYGVTLGLHNYPNQGVWFSDDASGFTSRYYNNGNGGSNTQTSLKGTFFKNNIGLGRQNLGIIMRPWNREMFLVHGDEQEVIAYQKGATIANWPSAGLIKPSFEFKNMTGASMWYRFSGITVRLVTG